MRTASLSMLCCLLTWLGAEPAAGADEGRKFNPFSQVDQTVNPLARAQVSDRSSGETGRGFRFPSPPPLPSLPKFELPKWKMMSSADSRRKPTTWDKINSNTKSFFAKTKATLMPWAENEPAPKNNDGSMRVARRQQRRAGSSSNIFSNLFEAKPEHKEIGSIDDFLALPRPSPDE